MKRDDLEKEAAKYGLTVEEYTEGQDILAELLYLLYKADQNYKKEHGKSIVELIEEGKSIKNRKKVVDNQGK